MMSTDRSDTLTPAAAFKTASLSGKAALILSTWFGSGLAPVASGTFGTLAALPLAYVVSLAGGAGGVLVTLALIGLAFWSSERTRRLLRKDDPSPVVIDEVAGTLVTLFLVPPSWLGWTAGFFLFRFFDILKPYPIRRLERLRGGLGIVADDLLAGVYARVVLGLILWLVHPA
ncbi:Phosphatidylglycerophosphatase A [uncultured Desulfatiglans sp.]|nr:Phosphatidylglycerophosphatase A [uncultured Desulfatiglans sp.]